MSAPFETLDVALTIDGDVVRLTDGAPSSGAGVYRIGGASILVLDHRWSRTRIDLVRSAGLPSIAGIVAIAVLPSKDSLARIIVDVIEPPTLDPETVAVAAVHAAYDEELAPEALVECAVRMPGHDARVRLVHDGARWTTTITEAGDVERRALAGCALFRSIREREEFGAWTPAGFRIEDDPRAADNAVWFSLYAIGGLELAVITEQVTPSQLDELAATPRLAAIDAVVAITHEPMSMDISVSAIAPGHLGPFGVATAAACGAASSEHGAAVAEYRVRLCDGQTFEVALDFDDEDRTWSARVSS